MASTLSGSLIEPKVLRSSFLMRIRLLALRRRILFKVLDNMERGILYLASKVVSEVRSRVLANALNVIVKKLLGPIEESLNQQMKQIGVPLAEKISKIAQKWGNRNAVFWACDRGFIRYLTVTRLDPLSSNNWNDY